MRKRIWLTLGLLGIPLPVQAQQVKGLLQGEQNDSVEYAIHQLLDANDSIFIIGSVSDKQECFQLELPGRKDLS